MQFKIEKTEHVNRTFRITKELADTLSEIAQREGISVNELVVQCCNYAISNMEETNDKKNYSKEKIKQESSRLTPARRAQKSTRKCGCLPTPFLS